MNFLTAQHEMNQAQSRNLLMASSAIVGQVANMLRPMDTENVAKVAEAGSVAVLEADVKPETESIKRRRMQ